MDNIFKKERIVMAAKLREEYCALSSEELLQKVYDLGVAYETNSYSCSQSTVASLYRVLDFPDALVKASTSNAGGTALHLFGSCGGLVGGIMVLDYFFGRPFELMSDREKIQDPNIDTLLAAQPIASSLCDKYVKEYGSITCAHIQRQLYGRVFWLEDMDDFQKLDDAGGHSNPEKCPRIVGNAARWTMEILFNNGGVER